VREKGVTVTSAVPATAAEATTFAEAFPALWRAGYRVAYRLLGSREDAADCAQEACTRACVRWARLARGGDPTPWVVRVAANLAIDRWRRGQRAVSSVADRSPDGSTLAADRIDLHRALAGLARRQREVVMLRFVADLTEADVAEELGISVGSVKQHAARGLAALRSALTEDAR